MTDTNATTIIAPIEPLQRASGFSEFWYYFTRNKGAVLGLVVFAITVLIAILAPWIAPHPP
jgi:dipeptide transport system permease protein